MPTLQLYRRTSLFWFQGAWELGRVFGGELFCFCLFVCCCCFCFQLLRWVIILFFKSHKWVRFCFVFVCVFFVFVFCFVLFFLENVQFPHHNLRSGWFFFVSPVFCFLLFLFVCFCFLLSLFYFILFCFVLFFLFLLPKIPSPLISNGAPLSLFYYTDDGGHNVIDNFELPCNSVKNLIPICNFTNTFIQECKIIWEFQIRWGGTSLLRPLWRSWRYLKAYSLMSNTGRFQNFKNLIFFFFFAYFRSPPLRSTIPKRN